MPTGVSTVATLGNVV